MKLSVIIPVHNGGDGLRRCLEALAASSRQADEVIVVDDGSTDDSAATARGFGARLLPRTGGPRGPAAARNHGAETARGDVLVFLDADVAVHEDTLARIEGHLQQQPGVAALFGSYDDAPPARGLVTRYKNLLHHHVHQHGRREASTFWAGCGAVRRDVFLALGGFDPGYTRPSIEDIELGGRLRRAGHRVWLCPDVQVAHLKRWTLAGWLRADIFYRAVPWTRLILRSGVLPDDLNLGRASRLSALAAWALIASLALGAWSPGAWLGLLPALGTLWACNAGLFRFFRRRGGWGFAAGAAALHGVYFLYSSATFALIAASSRLARHGLALLLLVTLLKGLAWSVLIPPWQALDEAQHFLYAQHVSRFRTLRVPPNAPKPEEAWRMADLVQYEAVRFDVRPLGLPDRSGVADALHRLNDPGIKRVYAPREGLLNENSSFTGFHPPFYYAALALVQAPLEGHSILVRNLAGRWLSTLLGLFTVLLAYRAGRELWPARPGGALLLATLISFYPMVTLYTAVMSNQALEITLFCGILVAGLRVIRHGLTRRRALTLGALVALGLATKISFLGVLPLLGMLFLWDLFRPGRARGPSWRLAGTWAPVALVPLLLAGWWYASAVQSGGDTLVRVFDYDPVKKRPEAGLLQYLLHYDWLPVYGRAAAQHLGSFGWTGAALPIPLRIVMLLTALVAAAATGAWLLRQARARPRPETAARLFSVCFLGCATLCLFAFYVYVDYRMYRSHGGYFLVQGRYFLPAIIGQMAWLVRGTRLLLPAAFRAAGGWLLGAAMAAVKLDALFAVVAPRDWGAAGLPEVLRRAALIPPGSHGALAALCLAVALLTPALLLALAGTLAPDRTSLPHQEVNHETP